MRLIPTGARTSVAGAPALAPGWSLALVLAAGSWLLLPALAMPFFADDYLFLDQVRDHSLLAALLAPDPLSNFIRPVSRQLYFWLIAHGSGESSRAFHAANLALFLGVVALLFLLARRLAGARAGVIAAGFLALHYAADVPVFWACGSQELLAVAGALGATLLHLQGRRALAALALLLAVLSKEVALLSPFIILAADHRAAERWVATVRRGWPLAAVLAVWLLLWLAVPHRRAQQATEVELRPGSPLAALVHLPQVAIGLEWRQGEVGHVPKVPPPWGPLALVLVAVLGAWPRPARARIAADAAADAPATSPDSEPSGHAPRPGHAIRVGLVWALLAAAPVAAVAILWSAYYYLFAICGVALALGAWTASLPRGGAALVVGLLAWGSESARSLDEFAVPRDPWTGASHINRFYIARATRQADRYLADLKRLHPTFPPNSTLFFSGLKGNIAFLAGDGPLQRWAYRDHSLRAHYLSALTLERARRGPAFFFLASQDTLHELAPGPGLYSDVAVALILGDHLPGAHDALRLEREHSPATPGVSYRLAWVQWALGDRHSALAALEAAGAQPLEGPSPEVMPALNAVQSGDTLLAIAIMREAVMRRGLDPGAHALLADLSLARDPADPTGAIEAFVTRVLAPQEPSAWRRWGMVQAHRGRYLESVRSFERYFALGGEAGRADAQANQWVAKIRTMVPGGDLAAEGLREERVSIP